MKAIAALLAVAGAWSLTTSTQAAVLLQPTGATSTMGPLFTTALSHTYDQSGPSAGYSSLVTDVDTYLASNPTHQSFDNINIFLGRATPGNIDYSLGGTYPVQSVVLWSRGSGQSYNAIDFEVYAADNAAFSNPTLLGTFTADPNAGTFLAAAAQRFDVTTTTASYVRLRFLNAVGGVDVIVGEVAFAVPEPTSLSLLVGAASLLLRRRKSTQER
jgi:hypothetical protein